MKLVKKIFINLLVIVVALSACIGLTACKEDIRTVEFSVQVYDYDAASAKTVTLTADLYGHLAPETVDAITAYLEEGYYTDTVFYQLEDFDNQIMIGDYKFADGLLTQNDIKPEIKGEFKNGGVVGSNLINERGYIGLWRNAYVSDGGYMTSSSARDSGRATMYLPTEAISNYNDWLCVFAKIDLTAEDNAAALSLIEAAYGTNATIEEYVVYYTGEYDAEKKDENFGLTYNCELEEDFDKEMEGLFVAEGEQYECYNYHTVKLAVYGETKAPAVKITSVKVK
ncbi:MAG: hypothetical protein E7346_06195 [Clostridiales bacterium]|nr:hypothetical protein [Clostridiales bacterium]